MEWMAPEIREDAGEIEAAIRQAQSKQPGLPKLIELKDIKGDLHIHSNYDLKSSHDLGRSSLKELLDQASVLNYEYIGISDHNPKVSDMTENQIVTIMKRRREKFEQIYSSWNLRVKKRVHLFVMLETDITPTGKLALPELAMEYIDACIVSVHSSFNLSKPQMTKRILDGLSHPKAKILGHPTGRLLGSREGYEANWEEIFDFCLKNNKTLEINSWPQRLDLPDRLVREAVKKGVKLVVSTDSHALDHMDLMQYGVDVARRGWAEKKDILNTLSYNEFAKWLKS
jgi:DNA polymerase (family 10)